VEKQTLWALAEKLGAVCRQRWVGRDDETGKMCFEHPRCEPTVTRKDRRGALWYCDEVGHCGVEEATEEKFLRTAMRMNAEASEAGVLQQHSKKLLNTSILLSEACG